jgi:hypothetical protein
MHVLAADVTSNRLPPNDTPVQLVLVHYLLGLLVHVFECLPTRLLLLLACCTLVAEEPLLDTGLVPVQVVDGSHDLSYKKKRARNICIE